MSAPLPYPGETALPAVNLYTSREFLRVVARVYHPGRSCQVQDHAVDGQLYRLLSVDGAGPQLRQPFLDLHEALGPATSAGGGHRPALPRLPEAVQGLLPLASWRGSAAAEGALGAPTVVWDGFAQWSDYLQLLRTRRVLAEDQRRSRRLAELRGPLQFTADDPCDDVMPQCIAWKNARDRSLARPSLLANPAHQQFFAELRACGLLRASTLRAGGTLMAVWLGAVYQGRWSGWVYAFNPDPALSRCSPGRLLLYPMLEASHQAGHREFDFSIGLEPYKLQFATHVRPVGPVGTAPWPERARRAVRHWLGASPWCLAQARAARHWWQARPGATPAAATESPP